MIAMLWSTVAPVILALFDVCAHQAHHGICVSDTHCTLDTATHVNASSVEYFPLTQTAHCYSCIHIHYEHKNSKTGCKTLYTCTL